MRIITLEDLHQHVLELAAGLQIEWIESFGGEMPKADADGTIHVHPIKSENAYAVALHEIGHVRTGRFDDVLIEERQAWDWARANALVWTPVMQREAEGSTQAYETDDRPAYYYDQILAFVEDLLCGNADGEEVCEALVRNAVELAVMYNNYDAEEARQVLTQLVEKHLAAE